MRGWALPHPIPPSAQHSVVPAGKSSPGAGRGWLNPVPRPGGGPGGVWLGVGGEGTEPPSYRSRPLVSCMSRHCHTHLMWFLAGAAAALPRLIAARGALQTDSRAPLCPRGRPKGCGARGPVPTPSPTPAPGDARCPRGTRRGVHGQVARRGAGGMRCVWGARRGGEGQDALGMGLVVPGGLRARGRVSVHGAGEELTAPGGAGTASPCSPRPPRCLVVLARRLG